MATWSRRIPILKELTSLFPTKFLSPRKTCSVSLKEIRFAIGSCRWTWTETWGLICRWEPANSATLTVCTRRVFAVLSARIPGSLASSQDTRWSDLKPSRANSAIWAPSGTTGMTLSESRSTVPGATQCRRSTEKAESINEKILKGFLIKKELKERKKVDGFQTIFNLFSHFSSHFWICWGIWESDLLRLLIGGFEMSWMKSLSEFLLHKYSYFMSLHFRDKKGDFELKDFKNPKPDKLIETKNLTWPNFNPFNNCLPKTCFRKC